MKSHEVLKGSMEHVGVKTIASDLGVSPSLLYKWCQPGGEPTDSGATNPLDRLAKIFEATGDDAEVAALPHAPLDCSLGGGLDTARCVAEHLKIVGGLPQTCRMRVSMVSSNKEWQW